MHLNFSAELGSAYRGPTQRIRILSEHWLQTNMYCPACGADNLVGHTNNKPVADFYCARCHEDYELKSQAKPYTRQVADGAYTTMIERLKDATAPNFLLLSYSRLDLTVRNLTLVPKHFMTSACIERRPPLSATARRHSWVGCKILLERIPQSGRINIIIGGIARPKADVLHSWTKTSFLRDHQAGTAKGWLLDVMKIIESLGRPQFSLDDVYGATGDLQMRYPNNANIRPKIRQQLQVLRDRGYLDFLGRAHYALKT